MRGQTRWRLADSKDASAADYIPTHVASRLFALAVPACRAVILLLSLPPAQRSSSDAQGAGHGQGQRAQAKEGQLQLVEAAVTRVHGHLAWLAEEAREAAELLETRRLSLHLWTTDSATQLRVTSGVAVAAVLKAALPLLPRLYAPVPPATNTSAAAAAAAAAAAKSRTLLESMMGAGQLLACQGGLTKPGTRTSVHQPDDSGEAAPSAASYELAPLLTPSTLAPLVRVGAKAVADMLLLHELHVARQQHGTATADNIDASAWAPPVPAHVSSNGVSKGREAQEGRTAEVDGRGIDVTGLTHVLVSMVRRATGHGLAFFVFRQ